jgi:hypothetical protein
MFIDTSSSNVNPFEQSEMPGVSLCSEGGRRVARGTINISPLRGFFRQTPEAASA